jgi:hypothetical protein
MAERPMGSECAGRWAAPPAAPQRALEGETGKIEFGSQRFIGLVGPTKAERGVRYRALVVSHFFSSVIGPKGQWDDPRLIGGTRRRLEQVCFIGSQV